MAIIIEKATLRGLTVTEAMRRQVIRLPRTMTIEHAVNYMIKYKINAILTVDADEQPVGVVSKTDIMGAYYAGLPIDSPVENIMNCPPLFCHGQDSLESALDLMRAQGVYRLYVLDRGTGELVGALAYPDIVGMLYQYCHRCRYSHRGGGGPGTEENPVYWIKVKEVMTGTVESVMEQQSLQEVIEKLSACRIGAVLVTDADRIARGVVSKTDLTLAYKHHISFEQRAAAIMSTPVQSCDENELLENAIKNMIFSEVQRIFVCRDDPLNIVGVLSLSDAARLRSGSCQACLSSRIKVDAPV